MSIKVLVISNYRKFHETRPEAEIFIGLAQRGFEVTVMTYSDAEYRSRFVEAGIRVIDFHPQKKLDRREIAIIRKELIEGEYDILQLYNGLAITNGLQAARGLPVKVLLYRGYSGNIHWYDPLAYLKYLHPRVDMIVCNAEAIAQDIKRQSPWTRAKVTTIHKGHRVEWYEETEANDMRKELGLPPEAFLLISVANNRKMKGIPYLLRAINELPRALPIHLILVGRDMDSEASRAILGRGPNADRVHFLGFRKDVLSCVAGSDAFVLASIKGEALTKSVVEAMALQRPCIITDIPGNRELLVHELSGLVVPKKDPSALSEAILRLYEHPGLCQGYGEMARQRIRDELNTDRTIEKMQALYEELVVG